MDIGYCLPSATLSNADLVRCFPEWTEDKILSKTGIASRHIVQDGDDLLTLAEGACQALFEKGVEPSTVDFVLMCTQSPVYRLPSTACLLQSRLGLATSVGALDYDLGCSGFVYGLAMAKGLVAGHIARRVLLVTAETYTQYLDETDKSTRSIFGDGAAAALIDEGVARCIGEFVLGTDGSGADKLIVRPGGHLHMDGPEIFNFTLEVVPRTITKICERNGLAMDDVDLFVFHQANKFMLETIRKVTAIPRDKFYINMEDIGNTVSSTIPIALKRAEAEGRLKSGMRVMLVGFGVGLSWGGTILEW